MRADRGIDSPKDLEGKTLSTGSYNSIISVYTRGFLQHRYGVDVSTIRWLLNGPGPFPIHDTSIQVDYATGPAKSAVQRLLDGEIDGSTGDITESAMWTALESRTGEVKRMIPDYLAANERLLCDDGIYTPVHVIAIGNRLTKAHPEIARTLLEGFQRSKEIAIDDALGDGTSFSLNIANREHFRDQYRQTGDHYPYGVAKNRTVIDLALDYCHEQGVTQTRLSVEQVFAPGTLEN